MPGKSRSTGTETPPQIPVTTTTAHRQNRTRKALQVVGNVSGFLTLSRFSFLKHLMRFSSLLFQRMIRAALFYDEEGKQVSISLQGDHLNLSRCSLQHYWLLLLSRGNVIRLSTSWNEEKTPVAETAPRRVVIPAVGLVSIITVECAFPSTGRVTKSSFNSMKHATQT